MPRLAVLVLKTGRETAGFPSERNPAEIFLTPWERLLVKRLSSYLR